MQVATASKMHKKVPDRLSGWEMEERSGKVRARAGRRTNAQMATKVEWQSCYYAKIRTQLNTKRSEPWSSFREDYRLAFPGHLTRQIRKEGHKQALEGACSFTNTHTWTQANVVPYMFTRLPYTRANTQVIIRSCVCFLALFAGWVSGGSAEGKQMPQLTWIAWYKWQLLSCCSTSRWVGREGPALLPWSRCPPAKPPTPSPGDGHLFSAEHKGSG